MRLVSSKEFDVRAADPDRDFDVFYDLLCTLLRERDSYVMVNYMGATPTREELKERSKVWNRSRFHLGVAFCNNLLVGYTGALVGPNFGTAQPDEAEIYYAVRREYRGAGLSYALLLSLLNRLSVKYIHAYVYVGNTPSIRTLEALGLNRLTLLEEYIYHTGEGRYHDLYLYRGLRLEAVKKARERLVHRGYKIVEV